MGIAWTWQAKDAKGNLVESAPGKTEFYCRGPVTREDMIRGAKILLDNKRLHAMRFGLEDPGYVLDESTLKDVDEGTDPVEQFKAKRGLVPINLASDIAVAPKVDALIAKREAKNPTA